MPIAASPASAAPIRPERAREAYGVPEGFQVLTALAIGYLADPESLPEKIRARDQAVRMRRPIEEFVFTRRWGQAAELGCPEPAGEPGAVL